MSIDLKWTENGKEYWNRAAVISTKPDFTVVKATVESFWGKNERNDGGMVVSWQTVSAGFGELTVYMKDGQLRAETECMSKQFCKEVLNKLFDNCNTDV